MEVTENLTMTHLDIPDTPDDDVDGMNTSRMSPFPQSEIITDRTEAGLAVTDLAAVRKLINRVKSQGEKLHLSDKHYLNITGQAEPTGNKTADTVSNDKYQVNQQFIKKVMEFSSSSSSLTLLSSDESSSFRPVKLPLSTKHSDPVLVPTRPTPIKSKSLSPQFFNNSVVSPIPKSVLKQNSGVNKISASEKLISKSLAQMQTFGKKNITEVNLKKREKVEELKQFDNNQKDNQKLLRYYIEKLLQMKHDEISDLSVTTDNSNMTTTNTSANSSEVEQSRELLRQYKVTRNKIFLKLHLSTESESSTSQVYSEISS